MAERANRTIKQGTIKAQEYHSFNALEKDLNKFLLYYNFNRRHGSLRKEFKVKTPFEALQSCFQSKSELFRILPNEFRAYAFRDQVHLQVPEVVKSLSGQKAVSLRLKRMVDWF